MYLPDFLIIPSILILDKSIHPIDREIYGLIYWASKLKNEKCTLSNKSFSELLNISESSVSHALSRLHKKRYIYIAFNEQERGEIVPLISFSQGLQEFARGVVNSCKGGSKNLLHNKNIKKDIIIDNKINSSILPVGSTSKTALVSCTPLEIWTIAKDMDISLANVREKHKQIMELIATGEFQKRYPKHKTVYYVLRTWLRMGLEKKTIPYMNEIERLDLESEHPDEIAKREELKKWAQENKLIE